MTLGSILVWIIVGGVGGWLAGLLTRSAGFGLVGNVLLGIIGAVVAGWLLPRLGIVIGGGILAAIVNAVIGAVLVLIVARLLFGARRRR